MSRKVISIPPNPVSGVISVILPPSPFLLATASVQATTLTLANTEVAVVLPASSRAFWMQARGTGKIRLSFASAAEYWTIFAGCYFYQDGLGAVSTTLYVQSPVAGMVVETLSWA